MARRNAVIHLDPKNRSRSRERDDAPIESNKVLEDLGIKSFDKEYARLLRMMRADDDFTSAQAAQALIRAQLGSVIGVMPIIEKSVHKYGSKAAYAMVAVGDHARALAHDLRSFGDQSALVEKIRRDVFQAALKALATELVSKLSELRHDVHSQLPESEAKFVDRRLRGLQESFTSSFAGVEREAHDLLKKALQS